MIVETVTETRVVVDWAEVAQLLEPKIMNKMRDGYDHWKGDIGMCQMVVADAADGLSICEMLAADRPNDAHDALWHMDTSPREDILAWIEDIAGGDALAQIW